MLTAKDPPYDDVTVSNARAASRKVEGIIFDRATDRETYERKIRQKIESMNEQIVKQRAKRALEAEGQTMAEAPAKHKVPREAEARDARAETSDATATGYAYEEGRRYFYAVGADVQKRLRANALTKWLEANRKTSQIARDFITAKGGEEKKRIYNEKLRGYLDEWVFKYITMRLEMKRRESAFLINSELQGFVTNLMTTNAAEDGGNAAKRQATEAARAKAAMVEPTSDYWLKVHELNEKYHAPLSRALKSVRQSKVKLVAIRQKFVDLLANRILPTIEQTPKNRNLSIPPLMSHLLQIETAIKKALAKYEATQQIKQEQKRLEAMTPTQRAVASLTEGGAKDTHKEARAAIRETCASLKSHMGVDGDFSAERFDSDEDEVDDSVSAELLKDLLEGEKALTVLPAGAPNTWTLELGNDVVAVAFKGYWDSMSEDVRVKALAEY